MTNDESMAEVRKEVLKTETERKRWCRHCRGERKNINPIPITIVHEARKYDQKRYRTWWHKQRGGGHTYYCDAAGFLLKHMIKELGLIETPIEG